MITQREEDQSLFSGDYEYLSLMHGLSGASGKTQAHNLVMAHYQILF